MRHRISTRVTVKWVSLIVITASMLAVFYSSRLLTHANSADWFSSGATTELIEDPLLNTQRVANHIHQCRQQKILVGNSLLPTDRCVYQAKSFRFAYIEECTQTRWGCNPTNTMAVSIGSDSRYYRINNLYPYWDSGVWHVSPESDRVVLNDGGSVRVIDNLITVLDRSPTVGGVEYSLSTRNSTSIGDQTRTVQVAMSNNGEWLVGHMKDYGLFRMRLSDGNFYLFADEALSLGAYEFSISDDGQYVATAGDRQRAKLYRIDGGCGKETTAFWNEPPVMSGVEGFVNCPSQSLIDILASSNRFDHENVYVDSIRFPAFSWNGESITLLEKLGGVQERWVRVHKPGHTPFEIEYLAMGDSYSSGEGDVGRKSDGSSYYLSGTESRGQCHVSSRSYPFLLATHYGISSADVASVACSGAKVLPDMVTGIAGYMGQDEGLVDLDDSQREERRKSALENFSPGVVPQIEFVRLYKPKVVTLTGGGNDVGFAEILKYCAGFTVEDFAPIVDSDCGFAIAGSILEKLLYDSIDTQYDYNKNLISKIKELSPDTHIVIIGYPSFINSDMHTCSLNLNSGFLSKAERRVINTATTRMNDMLQRLAYDTRVSFVDVEGSLHGGRMCEGSSFVTGISAAGYRDVVFDEYADETFHPNHLGHKQIAQTAIQTGALAGDNIPYLNGYIKPDNAELSLAAEIVQGGWFMAGSAIKVATDPFTFMRDTYVDITAYSETVDLGTYEVGDDGRLAVSINTDTLPAGNHVIVIKGLTYSGEPIKYYQFVSAIIEESPESNDLKPVGEPETEKSSVSRDVQLHVDPSDDDSLTRSASPGLSSNLAKRESISPSASLSPQTGQREVLADGDRRRDPQVAVLLMAAIVGLVMTGGIVYAIKSRWS